MLLFLSQWDSQKDHLPAIIGVLASIACLLVFGMENFIIPSMIAILISLTLNRKKLEKEEIK